MLWMGWSDDLIPFISRCGRTFKEHNGCQSVTNKMQFPIFISFIASYTLVYNAVHWCKMLHICHNDLCKMLYIGIPHCILINHIVSWYTIL